MAQTAAHLVDQVLPDVPVRQWVLSLPIPLRYLLAAHPKLLSPALEIVQRVITGYLAKKSALPRSEIHTGAVTLIQRFGSAANLNIHFHSLVLDGVYRIENGQPVFHPVAPPTTAELARLLERIVKRVLALLTRRGYWVAENSSLHIPHSRHPWRSDDHDIGYLEVPQSDEVLAPLQAAACSYRIAMGPRAGRKAMNIRTLEARPSGEGTACVESNGFSLHAGVSCARGERKKLERLCRYDVQGSTSVAGGRMPGATIARPPISNERLKLSDCGQVVYELKTPYRDGTTHIVMSPLATAGMPEVGQCREQLPEWMQRLAALVPRPRMHLIRYHGVLAPNAKWRSHIVPAAPIPDCNTADSAGEEEKGGRHYLHWPLTHIHVLRGTWTSCPAGTPAQARVRD